MQPAAWTEHQRSEPTRCSQDSSITKLHLLPRLPIAYKARLTPLLMLINRCRLMLLPPDVAMDRALTVTMLFGVTLHDLLIRPELPSIPVVAGMISFMARCPRTTRTLLGVSNRP